MGQRRARSEQVSLATLPCCRTPRLARYGPFRRQTAFCVNQTARENFEVKDIWLPSRFRTNTLLVNYGPRLAEGSASPAFGFVSSRAVGASRHQSSGEPERRGIISRKRASVIMKSS